MTLLIAQLLRKRFPDLADVKLIAIAHEIVETVYDEFS